MHKYTSNKSYRKRILSVITIISLILNASLAPLIDLILEKLNENLEPYLFPFIVLLGVGFTSIFGVIYWVFNKFIWKVIPYLKKQNISGTYECAGKSNYKISDWKGTIIIKQTWTKILISLSTETSYSKSYMANIEVDDNGVVILYYCYKNEPNGKVKELKKHEGTTEILFEGSNINGKYYNYPLDRQAYGTLSLTKKKK